MTTCVRCGHQGNRNEFIITPFRGKTLCNDAQACDERAAERQADPDRVRNPLPDRNILVER